ncbi:type I restriction enzyme S subunit [Sphingomonas sp. PP-CC-3G-468]|nr:type I restriction enzyme S subunit [Sphingomonas sp. PP-CC-3G-468]
MLPSLAIQDNILGVLQTIDDKIELNRRMNETLEASARALFRDWFVDFGPTRAKAEGSAAYLAPDLWSLFPDRLGDDDVPASWRLGSLADLMSISPKEPLKSGVVAPYLDMAALPTRGSTTDLPIDRVYSSGTRFRNGDTLLARITPCLENGKTGYVQNLPENSVGWGSTEFIVLRTKPAIPSAVSYLVARDDEFRRHAIQSMTGTSGRQRANADAVARYPAVIPDSDKLWQALGTILDPIFDQIASSERESRALAETRDTLLPKLMSGAIRVRDAESAVAALC